MKKGLVFLVVLFVLIVGVGSAFADGPVIPIFDDSYASSGPVFPISDD